MLLSNSIGVFLLMTRVCLTSGILSRNVSLDSPTSGRLSSGGYRYTLTRLGQPFQDRLEVKPRVKENKNDGFEIVASKGGFAVPKGHQSTSHWKVKLGKRDETEDEDKSRTLLITRQSHSANNTDRGAKRDRCDPARSFGDCRQATTGTLGAFNALKTSDRKLDEDRPETRRRSSYRITEDPNDSSPQDRPEDDKFSGYPGYLGPKDVATAAVILENFLSRTLNDDDYNSELHPPTNPILALVLSKYGHYLSGVRTPRIYSNMAVNNIHNNKPFGKYKLERDDDPVSFITR